MRLANLGHTPDEIAEQVELPPGLWADWSCHGYYGTALPQRPGRLSALSRLVRRASLQPRAIPAGESAVRYVEFMGGMDALLANARRTYDEGDYRWVAQVLRHAVFADPDNQQARALQADAFEQLGYQAEAGPWRDVYLMGAMELRQGTLDVDFAVRPILEAAQGMTVEQIFDYLAVRLDGPAAAGMGDRQFTWTMSDTDDVVRLTLSNGTLHAVVGRSAADPIAGVRSARAVLDELVASGDPLRARVDDGSVEITGDADWVLGLWDLLVDFPMFFPIVEP